MYNILHFIILRCIMWCLCSYQLLDSWKEIVTVVVVLFLFCVVLRLRPDFLFIGLRICQP